jgi:hypothetical protein
MHTCSSQTLTLIITSNPSRSLFNTLSLTYIPCIPLHTLYAPEYMRMRPYFTMPQNKTTDTIATLSQSHMLKSERSEECLTIARVLRILALVAADDLSSSRSTLYVHSVQIS